MEIFVPLTTVFGFRSWKTVTSLHEVVAAVFVLVVVAVMDDKGEYDDAAAAMFLPTPLANNQPLIIVMNRFVRIDRLRIIVLSVVVLILLD